MPKRHLTPAQAFDLRQALHVATLDALMASRRWEPGELVFQGGTSLHLAYGSPRYSEDLDFLVNSSLNLQFIAAAVQARLEGVSWLVPQGAKLVVSKAKDAPNPHTFVVAIGGPDLIGAVRGEGEAVAGARIDRERGEEHRQPHSPGERCRPGLQTFVPTAELTELYAEKVFALGARPYS